ncbi:hypothetical protein GGI12_003109, partial [Dipsacomyces acuminosporus]
LDIVKNGSDVSDDNSDYSYYYSADAGSNSEYSSREVPDSDRHIDNGNTAGIDSDYQLKQQSSSQAARTRPANNTSAVSDQTLGESMADTDTELDEGKLAAGEQDDGDDGRVPQERRTSSIIDKYANDHGSKHILPHIVTGPSAFYPSNEDSDEGDSIMGALEKASANRDADDEAGKYSLKVVHIDAFSTSEATITAFADEMFSEVLHRALSIFNISHALKFEFRLHAQIQQRALAPLNYDGQVSSFLDYLYESARIRVPDSGAIDPEICTILLADKSLPQSRLLPTSSPVEDDPYMDLETSSRSILRTSIAASLSEAIQASSSGESANVSANIAAASTTAHATSQPADSAKKTFTVDTSAKNDLSADGGPQHSKARTIINSPSFGPNEKGDEQEQEQEHIQLPDSRQVVQGLLRSIPPPKTRPPQSAINKAKRNTVQISALGTIVGNDYRFSSSSSSSSSQPQPQPQPTSLSRSPSASGYSNKPAGVLSPATLKPLSSSATSPSDIDLLKRPASVAVSSPSAAPNVVDMPDVAALAANDSTATQPTSPSHAPNQALAQSASTLRPSSETATDEIVAGDHQESRPAAGADIECIAADNEDEESMPLSPTTSSDTASLQRSISNDVNTAAAPASTMSRLLLKGDMAASDQAFARSAAITSINGVLPSDDLLHAMQAPDEKELPLDDWLVILRGWNEMHDISTNASTFYQSFLKEMQLPANAGGNKDSSAQNEGYAYIKRQVAELQAASNDTQTAIDDILGVSQSVGRRLDTLERELDDIARILVHAN